MKKLVSAALIIAIAGCNSGDSGSSTVHDSLGSQNPSGIVNSNVISTDTGVWNIDTTGKPSGVDSLADSVFKRR